MIYTILHNPRCSKSRKTLELLESRGIQPVIRRYLDDPPSASEMLDTAGKLGVPVSALLRRGESSFREADDLPALDDDTALATWLSRNPIVIERPIVLREDGRACIGRPPENVLELIDNE